MSSGVLAVVNMSQSHVGAPSPIPFIIKLRPVRMNNLMEVGSSVSMGLPNPSIAGTSLHKEPTALKLSPPLNGFTALSALHALPSRINALAHTRTNIFFMAVPRLFVSLAAKRVSDLSIFICAAITARFAVAIAVRGARRVALVVRQQ